MAPYRKLVSENSYTKLSPINSLQNEQRTFSQHWILIFTDWLFLIAGESEEKRTLLVQAKLKAIWLKKWTGMCVCVFIFL
jgi:hypothetical protein